MVRRILSLLVVLLPMVLSAEGQTILYWGDSITDGGWGRSGGSMASAEERNHRDLNHLYGHSYMLLAASELESSHPEQGYRCYNRGISGYTLQDLTERWERDVEALRPDVVSILIGTNDVARYLQGDRSRPFDVAAWEAQYRALLQRTRQHNSEVKLMLCTPFVAAAGRLAASENFPEQNHLVAECSRVVRRLAREFDAVLVDFEWLFLQLQRRYSVEPSYWIWDGIHPTPAGHRRMADLWLKQFRKL